MWTKWTWNWRLTVPKTIKMPLFRPPLTKFKLTIRAACAVSTCSPFPLPTKFAHWLSGERSQPLDRSPPSLPQLLASKIKQTFLSTNLTLFWFLSSKQPDLTFSCMSSGDLVSLLYVFQRGWGHQAVALVSTLKQVKRHKCWVLFFKEALECKHLSSSLRCWGR